MVAAWNETTLPTLLSNYSLENVYNADEYGLFYQCLPNKSYQLKTEKCSGGKHMKIRITGLAAANAVGSKLPMFAIGKAKKPRTENKRTLRHFLADIVHRKKAGWTAFCLKNG